MDADVLTLVQLAHLELCGGIQTDQVLKAREHLTRAVRLLTPACDHSQWSFEKHGRVCPCGTMMRDFGD